MIQFPLSTPVQDNDPPTAECLQDRLPQLHSFLRAKGFRGIVIERAIDRVIHAALPHLRGDTGVKPLRDRVSWLFGSALLAARQVASREPRCEFVDPAILEDTIAEERNDDLPEAVADAVGQLTPKQREAVSLCLLQGRSLKEAAREMGCVATTVLRHRDRGMKRLRRILPELLPDLILSKHTDVQ